jgi:DNA polymerase-3 subunit gamma/tau
MSYRALYRKYRPWLFSDIIGQPGLVQALRSQVDAGRISHAYLFSGPRGTGKTSAAKVLSRAINCENPEHGEACGRCRPCVELAGDTNMDIVEIDAASNNSVDKVREMLENVKYLPAVGRFRVYIVDEVHMLSTSAFNALLKTLEEPPAHVVFILATTEPHKLPATVLSRCQQFSFRRIATGEMAALLQGVLQKEGAAAEPAALEAIARAADGGMRDALSLLDQCLALGEGKVTHAQVLSLLGAADSGYYFELSEALLGGDTARAVELLDRFLSDGGDIRTWATDLCRHLRDLYVAGLAKDTATVLDVDAETAQRFVREAARFAPGDVLRALSVLSELDGALRYAANPRVPAELAMFRCARLEKTASYDALLTRVERIEAVLDNGVANAAPRPSAAPVPQQAPAEPPKAAQHPPERKPVPAQSADVPPWEEAPPWDAAPPPELPNSQEPPRDLPIRPAPPTPPQERSSAAPMAQPAVGQPLAAAPERPAAAPSTNRTGGKLWQQALDEMKSQPAYASMLGFAAKGKGIDFKDGVLTVLFSPEEENIIAMLGEARRADKLKALLEKLTGGPVTLRYQTREWSESEQRFIDQSLAAIPKGISVTIEKD